MYFVRVNRADNLLIPRQPLLVLASGCYYKMEFGRYGISHFYKFHVDSLLQAQAQVVPDGTVDILFHCMKGKPEAVCYGTVLKHYCLKETSIAREGELIFGVRFFPGQAYLPGNFPIAELTEGCIDLWDILKEKEMIERICSCEDFKDQIQIFLSYYVKDYCREILGQKEDQLEQYLLHRILSSQGTVRLETLSQETYFSERYINQIFHKAYGLSPKVFEKLIRFQETLTAMRYEKKMTDIAADAGYYDQSHLIREFKGFMDMTPKRYVKELEEADMSKRLVLIPSEAIE